MKPEIAKLWVDALRSGEYKQGTGALCTEDGHCCLGVLCELAVKAGFATKHVGPQGTCYTDHVTDLPFAVVEWAGMASDFGRFGPNKDLATLNDGGTPFSKIADIIEQNVDKL